MRVDFLPPDAARDEALVRLLSDLVNSAYREAERGIWAGDHRRTDPDEVARDVRSGSIATAEDGFTTTGSIKTHLLDERTGWFGALAVDPALAGRGIGRALVAFAEDACAARGVLEMQIELLSPAGGHPHTDRLRAWYERLGYQPVRSVPYAEIDPDGLANLRVPVEVVVMRRRLA